MNEATATPPEITLGFTRGVSPSKWVRRWEAITPEQPLTIVPFPQPYGRPDGAEEFDMVLERTSPGAQPAGSVEGDAKTHHAVRLYDEAVAVVLPKGHDLTGRDSVSLAELAGTRILDHPHHAPEWPAAEPWEDPAWMPADIRGALELVATGLGGILMPAPLARHITDKHSHVTIRLSDPLLGGTVWASWRVERDAPDLQHLAGVMRGRTARSSRSAEHHEQAKAAVQSPKRTQPQKPKPKLKANSRGAQLQAATEKREREKAARRKAKRK